VRGWKEADRDGRLVRVRRTRRILWYGHKTLGYEASMASLLSQEAA